MSDVRVKDNAECSAFDANSKSSRAKLFSPLILAKNAVFNATEFDYILLLNLGITEMEITEKNY